ncbi:MAG: glycosyltransferase family 4 protein [Hyphomicrobium sp.]
MKLIFVNRYFFPDHSATSQLLSDLAFALAAAGQAVAVITSRQSYDDAKASLAPIEVVNGVRVVRIWTTRFGRSNLVGRAIDYLTFYLSAAWAMYRLARSGDVIVAKTDPPMLSVIAAPIARMRGAKLINWLQDLFPEVAQAIGVGTPSLTAPVFRFMKSVRDRSLKAASANVVLGDLMAKRVEALGVAPDHILIISNWADGGLVTPLEPAHNSLREDWKLSDKFVVGYSGNLGRAHEYTTLLDAIEELEKRSCVKPSNIERPCNNEDHSSAITSIPVTPPIVWLFIGGGALYDAFQREAKARGLTSVVFKPYQPRDRLSQSLSAADVHLVSLRPDLEGLIVPSKFHGITAVGRPTLFIGDPDGEIAQLVKRYDCGLTVPQGDGSALAAAIRDLARDPERRARLGANARRAFEAAFDKPIAVTSWQRLLAEVTR